MMRFKNMLNLFNKTEVQEDKTHPTYLSQTILNRLFGRVLEREGVKVSCAEHTEKDLSSNRLTILTTLKHKLDCFAYARNDDLCAEHTEKDLFSYSPIHLFTFKKVAFTLAEVLITLGIIGVVAAVTLPTLVQNYKKTVYVNQLKKFVSIFEQGLQKMLADEGVQRLSDLPGLGTSYYTQRATGAQAFIDDFLSKGFYVTYKDAQGYLLTSVEDRYQGDYTNHMQLNDGSIIMSGYSYGKNALHETSAECNYIKSKGGTMCSLFMSFLVDVNGVKGPNREGRDVFQFNVSDEGKLYPNGGKDFALYMSPNPPLKSHFSYWNSSNAYAYNGCDGNSKMGGCAARIIENGWKMDY